MIGFLLIGILIVVSTCQSILTRFYSTSYPGREDLSSPIFTVVSGFVLVIVTFCLAGFRFEASSQTLIIGLVNALALVLYNTSMLKASANGPYSVTVVFMIAGGIVIPAIVSAFFGDDLNWVKIISILVVLVSVYLISYKDGENYKNKKLFFIACAGLFVGNGVYGSLIDVHFRLTTSADMTSSPEREEVLIITYLGAALISAVMLIVKTRKDLHALTVQSKKSLGFLIAASVVIAAAVNLVVYTIGFVDTTILYTFDNSCVFLLSVLFSCIVFKEKLTRLNVIGCVTLCVALVSMSLSPQIAAYVASLF
ncbi:MAG: hypothetical protein IJX80_02040 [Clostridia bacterium]|nr:hypothetical protein [Clostridia bacterium]